MELSNPYLSAEVAEAQEDVRSNPERTSAARVRSCLGSER